MDSVHLSTREVIVFLVVIIRVAFVDEYRDSGISVYFLATLGALDNNMTRTGIKVLNYSWWIV
jgi:hypothetical protein